MIAVILKSLCVSCFNIAVAKFTVHWLNWTFQSTYNKSYEYTLCSEKNTHSHFLSYLHEWCV